MSGIGERAYCFLYYVDQLLVQEDLSLNTLKDLFKIYREHAVGFICACGQTVDGFPDILDTNIIKKY